MTNYCEIKIRFIKKYAHVNEVLAMNMEFIQSSIDFNLKHFMEPTIKAIKRSSKSHDECKQCYTIFIASNRCSFQFYYLSIQLN